MAGISTLANATRRKYETHKETWKYSDLITNYLITTYYLSLRYGLFLKKLGANRHLLIHCFHNTELANLFKMPSYVITGVSRGLGVSSIADVMSQF